MALFSNPLKRSGIVRAMTGRNSFAQPQAPAVQPFNVNSMADSEAAGLRAYGSDASQRIMAGRANLSSSLAENGKSRFTLMRPDIMEDLNAKGLLTSPSTVGGAETNALKEIELANQERLLGWDEAALSTGLQADRDALDASSDLRRFGLEQQYADANANREEALARDLAKQQGRNSLFGSMIGAGGSIFGNMALARTLGGSGFAAGGGGAAGTGAGAAGGGAGAGGLAAAALPAALAVGGTMAYQSLSDKGKSVVAPLVNPIKTVSTVSKSIKKAFCFDASTPIRMADGSVKPIFDMDIDDETLGGKVESVRVAKTSHGTLYDYRGTKVTGSHAVRENDRWIRVEASPYSIPLEGESLVYSLVTSDHRIYVEDMIFGDEHESPLYEQLDMEESLEYLNAHDVEARSEALIN